MEEQSRSRSLSKNKKKKKDKKKKKEKNKEKERDKDQEKEKEKEKKDSSASPQRTHRDIEKGNIYEGVVTKVQDFGVFVQISGFKGRKEGLVHISNIREKRVTNPFDLLKRNQKVFVKVISIVNEKIALSMRDVD